MTRHLAQKIMPVAYAREDGVMAFRRGDGSGWTLERHLPKRVLWNHRTGEWEELQLDWGRYLIPTEEEALVLLGVVEATRPVDRDLSALIPRGMRLRRGGLRSAPKRVPADGYPPGQEETIEKGGRLYSVRIVQEPRHGMQPGVTSLRTVAIVHRLT